MVTAAWLTRVEQRISASDRAVTGLCRILAVAYAALGITRGVDALRLSTSVHSQRTGYIVFDAAVALVFFVLGCLLWAETRRAP